MEGKALICDQNQNFSLEYVTLPAREADLRVACMFVMPAVGLCGAVIRWPGGDASCM